MRARHYVALSHWGLIEISAGDLPRFIGRFPVYSEMVPV